MPLHQPPCLEQGCFNPADNDTTGRCPLHKLKGYQSFRKERLPSDWRQRVEAVKRRDKGICYLCGEAGADTVDHKQAGDNHSMSNLGLVHDRIPNSQGVNCHRYKTSFEAGQAKKDNAPVEFGREQAAEYRRRLEGMKHE